MAQPPPPPQPKMEMPPNALMPEAFLKECLQQPVKVKLSDESMYRGALVAVDHRLHIVLKDATEFSPAGVQLAAYPECFVRGNNVVSIAVE